MTAQISESPQLDGEQVPVRPGMTVLIPPSVRHRAIGVMKVLVFVVPKFDSLDEYEIQDGM